MTLGADEPQPVAVDGARPSGTGFYLAVAALIPLGLFLLLAAIPPAAPSPTTDCGIWGCPTNNAFAMGLLLIPGTPVTLVLAACARTRAARVLDDFPDSVEADTASTALFLARLAAVGTIAAWAWLLLAY
jgi:hypothetical protein